MAAENLGAIPLAGGGKIETGVEDHGPHMAGGPTTTPIPTGGAGSAHCQGQAGTNPLE